MKPIIFSLLLLACIACSESDKSFNLANVPDGCNLSYAAATAAADSLVDVAELEWGASDSTVLYSRTFWVYYPTPDQELPLLGPRVISVDCEDGIAVIIPRD